MLRRLFIYIREVEYRIWIVTVIVFDVIELLQPLVDSTLDDQLSLCEDERDLTVKILNEASFIFL